MAGGLGPDRQTSASHPRPAPISPCHSRLPGRPSPQNTGGTSMPTPPDTGTTDLLSTLHQGVLILTLNRPEARNAMSDAMNQALGAQLAWAELDPGVKCVVLTGAGRGFCAGGDVKGMDARGDGSGAPMTV